MRKINRLTAIRVAPVYLFFGANDKQVPRVPDRKARRSYPAGLAMTHYRRIVNARAINNGTDMIATIKDIRPSPMWRDTRRGHSITRVQAYSRFHGKMLECCPLSTGSIQYIFTGERCQVRVRVPYDREGKRLRIHGVPETVNGQPQSAATKRLQRVCNTPLGPSAECKPHSRLVAVAEDAPEETPTAK